MALEVVAVLPLLAGPTAQAGRWTIQSGDWTTQTEWL